MKKGQAALEFLTTYGWALLVILVMIGALVYFGLLNPSRALPARCDVPPGWQCQDYQITTSGVNVILINKLGEAVKDFNLTSATSDADGITNSLDLTSCAVDKQALPSDEAVTITCTSPAGGYFTGLENEKVKADFELAYNTTRGQYTKSFGVTLFAAVGQ